MDECAYMDGWVDKGMDIHTVDELWMDECIGGWINEWTYIHGWVGGWMGGQKGRYRDGYTVAR